MASRQDTEKLIEEMFQAALKEKFSQFARKYDPQIVFEVWTEIMGKEGNSFYFQKCGWIAEMTIQKALDGLDGCCDSIEASIQERLGKGNGEKEKV